jgi:hypothetical protein
VALIIYVELPAALRSKGILFFTEVTQGRFWECCKVDYLQGIRC